MGAWVDTRRDQGRKIATENIASYFYNDLGALTAGTQVYVSGDYAPEATLAGYAAALPKVTKADSDTGTSTAATYVVLEDVADTRPGIMVRAGKIQVVGFDTSGSSEGAAVYLSATAGGISLTSSGTGQVVGRVALPLSAAAGDGWVRFDLVGAGSAGAGGSSAWPSGTAAAPGAYFAADIDLGVYRVGSNRFGFSLGGVASILLAPTSLTYAGAATDTAGQDVWVRSSDAGASATAARAGGAFHELAGAGSAGSSGSGTVDAGAGGNWDSTAGAGGASTSTAGAQGGDGGTWGGNAGAGGSAAGTDPGGAGGPASIIAGAGGAKTGTGTANGGAGGGANVTAGAGGATASAGASVGGAGGTASISGAVGGAATAGTSTGGAGGAGTVSAGAGGASTNAAGGAGGAVNLTAGVAGASGASGANGGGILMTAGAGTGTGQTGIIAALSATTPICATGAATQAAATVANAGTLTAAQHRGQQVYQDASGGNVTMTTLTGTLLAAALPSLPTGGFIFLFCASNHATNTSTISGGTDVTLVGSGALTQTGGTFILRKTAATTFDLVRVG